MIVKINGEPYDPEKDFVRKAAAKTKDVAKIAWDVAGLYSDAIHGIMNLAIKVGLIAFLFPYIAHVCKILLYALSQGL